MADNYYEQEDNEGHFTLEDDSGELTLEDGNPAIDVPFIAATTSVFTPTVANESKARFSQVPVEVLVQGTSEARFSQVPVEVLMQPTSAARVSQVPVEVVVQNTRLTVNTELITWVVGDPEPQPYE